MALFQAAKHRANLGEFTVGDAIKVAPYYTTDRGLLQDVFDAADSVLPKPLVISRYRDNENGGWWVYGGETIPLYGSGHVPQSIIQASHEYLAVALALAIEKFQDSQRVMVPGAQAP